MEGYADIDGPVMVGLLELLGIAGLIALAVLLIGTLFWKFMRRRKQLIEKDAGPLRSPLEIALERLGHLESESARLEVEPFIVEVSDVVRDYLETALAIPAREQTSEEFLLTLHQKPGLPGTLQDHMPPFLEKCDLVKFARQTLAGSQRTSLLETAGTVVKETDAGLQTESISDNKEQAAG